MVIERLVEEEMLLSQSEVLTREEVLKQRARKIKKLMRIYREFYWELMEELKVQYREYYWEYGRSPFQEDEENNNQNDNVNNNTNGDCAMETEDNENFNMNHVSAKGNGFGNGCEVNGCQSKAMALTRFCHMHILSDVKQKLYKPCNYSIKSSTSGPILCGKPILRSIVPSYCPLHFQKAEKHVTKALKKAGLNVSSTGKLAPKFHVIVAEYVRQIQSKRRAAQKASLEMADEKDTISI